MVGEDVDVFMDIWAVDCGYYDCICWAQTEVLRKWDVLFERVVLCNYIPVFLFERSYALARL